jgi:hypothetical protein
MAYQPYPQSGPYQQRATQQGTDADYAAWQQRGGVSQNPTSMEDAFRADQTAMQRRSTNPTGTQTWGSGAMGSGSSPYSGWGGTGGTTGSTGRNAGLTGSTGGATPGSNPTGGSSVFDTTNRNAPSPWGSNNTTYGTNPVQPQGNPANWNGSSGLPPSPPIANTTNTDWWNNWNGGNYPTAPSAQTGQSNVPQYGTNPVMPTWNPNEYSTNPVGPGGNSTYTPYTPATPGYSLNLPSFVQHRDQTGFADPNMTTALQNYNQLFPWLDLQARETGNAWDRNENGRRFDVTFGETQQNNRYNQGLSTRQQQMAEMIAQLQQGNWEKDFGFNQEMGRGRLGLDTELGRGNLALGQTQAANQDWYNRSRVGLDTELGRGNLDVSRGQLDLNRLTQEQVNALNTARLAQEGALTREGYTNQQQIASMQAFGRAQRPSARWIRSW